INLKDFEIEDEVLRLVPREVCEKYQLIPVNRAGASLIVAMADPSNIFAVDDLKFPTSSNIVTVAASEVAIRDAVERYYAQPMPSYEEVLGDFDEADITVELSHEDDAVDLEKAADEAPVVRLVNLILLDAIKKGASDI